MGIRDLLAAAARGNGLLWFLALALVLSGAAALSSQPPSPAAAKGGLFSDSKGNVGIGTRVPAARLDVKGDLLVDGNARITGYINYRQRDCLKVKAGPAGAMCGEGYYAAGIWGRFSGEADSGGVVCCR